MDGVLKVAILCMTVLLIALGVLLALPRSQLRSFLLEALGWGGITGSSVLGVLNPLDAIPDVIPLLGQTDDFFYLAALVLCALLIRRERRLRSAPTADPLEGQLVFPGFFEKEIKPWRPKTATTRQNKSLARVPEVPRD
jgi:uncharacterized membrane protein YkvA (DUF1232 family)